MQQFKYTVRDTEGKTKEGLIEANSTQVASQILHGKGCVIISISEQKEGLGSITFVGGICIRDVANLTRQLDTMINSGLPLTDSLNILEKQIEKEKFKEIIRQLAESIQGGGTFADALAVHKDLFSLAYVNIVRAGESSGTLDKVLTNLANTLDKQREFQSTVKGAFIYPTIIMIAMVMVMVIILIFVF